MLFSSLEFLFLFLPITLLVFFILGRVRLHQLALAWLAIASMFFYGYWSPKYLILISVSIIFNFLLGLVLADRVAKGMSTRWLWIGGLLVNLGLLGYYKYANFFIDNLNTITSLDVNIQTIILPLGISFFTFQQVTYITDVSQGKIGDRSFLRYCLFVTFFPQLIAGPIVHHHEIMPQFAQRDIFNFSAHNLSIGLTIFTLGLFKKIVFADTLALYANPVFDIADPSALSLPVAWMGALAYTFQLYFDFSGYGDMAIGLSHMMGLKLPLNFYSPYKAINIIEFWRRWHMTLSRFLRDYLYIPLGGNRKGDNRRYLNLMITMLLGGLWHGAGWTYVAWGGLHGLYLVLNQFWHSVQKQFGLDPKHIRSRWHTLLACSITFVAVVISWVVFRASSLESAGHLLQAMVGFNGFVSTSKPPVDINTTISFWLLLSAFIVFFMPNTYELMKRTSPAIETYPIEENNSLFLSKIQWQPYSSIWPIATGFLLAVSILGMSRVVDFLYFQF